MAKIHGIKIITSTVVSGVPVDVDDELFVPDDISEDDARTLLRMRNRAEEIPAPKVVAEPAPAPASPNDDLLKLLDETVPRIEEVLQARVNGEPVISTEQIAVLLKAEEAGNTRVSAIDAIKAELKARGAEKDGLFKKLFSR